MSRVLPDLRSAISAQLLLGVHDSLLVVFYLVVKAVEACLHFGDALPHQVSLLFEQRLARRNRVVALLEQAVLDLLAELVG